MSEYRNPSRTSWNDNVARLRELMEEWGIPFEDYHVETGAEPRQRDNTWNAGERWARVTYKPRGAVAPVVMQLDTQLSAAKNLNAIVVTLEAIRMQERRGLGAITASHYLALAAPKLERDPYEVLQARPDADRDTIDALYRLRAKQTHPDAGGSQEAFEQVTQAKERIYQERGW